MYNYVNDPIKKGLLYIYLKTGADDPRYRINKMVEHPTPTINAPRVINIISLDMHKKGVTMCKEAKVMMIITKIDYNLVVTLQSIKGSIF